MKNEEQERKFHIRLNEIKEQLKQSEVEALKQRIFDTLSKQISEMIAEDKTFSDIYFRIHEKLQDSVWGLDEYLFSLQQQLWHQACEMTKQEQQTINK